MTLAGAWVTSVPRAPSGCQTHCWPALSSALPADLYVHPICAQGSALKTAIFKEIGMWFMDDEEGEALRRVKAAAALAVQASSLAA